MTTIMSTPAATRIAQIRSAMGHDRASTGFGLQLDSVRARQNETFTVGAPSDTATPGSVDAPATSGSDEVALSPTSAQVSESVPYATLFNAAGERHGVDPALLAAVAQIESAFDPKAISSAGAQGLMQFMPGTATEMGVDAFDPASAVDGAARYLRRELDRFESVELALAAYNAGPGAVQRYGGIPPFAETQRYVDKVLNALESYR